MLALCRVNGWASGGYRLATHPVQHACRDEVAGAADVAAEEMPTAVDGCGVVTFALPLERMALMFSRLEQVDGGARVAAAMRAHPELIRGPMAADSLLMRELEGWTAKGGAEGLLCAAGPDGLGIALKVEDGSMRAMRPALAELLRRLGVETGELGTQPLENSRGNSSARWWRSGEAAVEIRLPRTARSVVGSSSRWSEPASPRSGSLFCPVVRAPVSREESEVHAHRRHRPA